MTERPIAFTGPMVCSVLDGSKTQTRRLIRPQPDIVDAAHGIVGRFTKDDAKHGVLGKPVVCPHGAPGDQLWVREAFRFHRTHDSLPPHKVTEEADVYFQASREQWLSGDEPGRLRPAMFMPRWASRISLEVTGISVERLQAITDADAIAEGVGLTAAAIGVPMTCAGGETLPRAVYRRVWESINGAESWAANPWVWGVSFRRLTP